MFLLAGLLFACFTIAQRRAGISSWHATALVNVVYALLFVPFYFVFCEPRLLQASWQDLAVQALAQGVFVSILGLFFYAEASRRLGAPRAAVFGSLAPALSVLLSIPLLDEAPSAVTLAGILLVTIGVALVVTRARTPGSAT